jgi:hypothetical protein
MRFARAMRNGVGLQGPDLTAGTPLYTPDELGVEDPDADVAPVTEPVDADAVEEADAPTAPPATTRPRAASPGPPARAAHAGDGRRAGALLLRRAAAHRAERRTRGRTGRAAAPRPRAGRRRRAAALAGEQGRADGRPPARARHAADLWLDSRRPDGAGESTPT